MMKTVISTGKAPAAIGPYSQANLWQDMVFISGQLGLTPEGQMVQGGIEEQARQVLTNIQAILHEAGSSLEQVLKTTVFLIDMDEFAAMNKVYSEFFQKDAPARSTIQVARLPKDGKVEIEVVAFRS